MGGVWCRAERGHSPTYDNSKGPFASTISRWTDHVRQAYRKPKTHHRPPKPPQKPLRSHERLTISHPQLVKEQSSDGWRTATLLVPQPTPVPPPRKKKKRLQQELARSAYSMDDLNVTTGELSKSTFSLPERYPSEMGLDIKGSSSTLIVTPVLESRLNLTQETLDDQEKKEVNTLDLGSKIKEREGVKEELEKDVKEEVNKEVKEVDKEDVKKEAMDEEKDEEYIDENDFSDEIIPIEKETIYSSRTLIHSNLGYIDKLSAISEVSAESGFDDRTDPWKYSERSESVTSNESLTRDAGLNILAHIHNIHGMSHQSEPTIDVREQTAISKKEWLENILKEEHEPYLIPMETEKRDSEGVLLENKVVDVSGKPTSLPSDHLHLMNLGMETSVADNRANKTPPSTPEPVPNHSVLLGLLRTNSDIAPEATSQPYTLQGESIFLTNTKTNIIYKSLSSDNLTDVYGNKFPGEDEIDLKTQGTITDTLNDHPKLHSKIELSLNSDSTNPFNNSATNNQNEHSNQTQHLSGSSTTPENMSSVLSSFDFKEIMKSQQYMSSLRELQLSEGKPLTLVNGAAIMVSGPDVVNGIEPETKDIHKCVKNQKVTSLSVEEPNTKSSATSSRRSSLTDSLHEFELSIYDMLNESKKYRESSDEEESIKTIKCDTKH